MLTGCDDELSQFNLNHTGARLIWICLGCFIADSHYNNCRGFSELLKPPLSPINVKANASIIEGCSWFDRWQHATVLCGRCDVMYSR